MSNLQITLGIVGVLVIIGIVAHGIWTMRKNNQPVREKQRRQPITEPQQDAEPETLSTESVEEPTMDIEQMSMNLDLDEEDAPLPSMRVEQDEESEDQPQQFNAAATGQTEKPLSAEPAEQQQSEVQQQPEIQQEIPEQAAVAPQPPQQVISLFVKGSVQGALLLQMMTELGCKFGDMGIFHRYQQTSGNGPMIFSVANMFNPGTFDLDNIEQFETEGVALFMTLPQEGDGQQAFNMMLNAAKKLAMEIPQGQVLDGERQLLSRQSIQKTHQTIREFEKAQQDL
ncbi:cell division protein ZipA [Idiomarina seosinensis]|uniref:cell division protein ZipA n=1 Tax=Idiomarina seosinensis TaxID=281739 RepID=UPI00384EF4CD